MRTEGKRPDRLANPLLLRGKTGLAVVVAYRGSSGSGVDKEDEEEE